MIYAYEDKHDPQLKGMLKVGYTTIGVQERVRQQYNIVRPGEPPYRILVEESAMRQDGTAFMDHDVHRQLVKMGCQHVEGEWYRCTPQQVRAAIEAVRERMDVAWNRDKTFGMRPEQQAAVDKTAAYFDSYKSEADRVPPVLRAAVNTFRRVGSVLRSSSSPTPRKTVPPRSPPPDSGCAALLALLWISSL